MSRLSARDRDSVTERRERILELTRQGRCAWQIAFDLGLSERTVQRHRGQAASGRPVWDRRRGFTEATLAKMRILNEMDAQGKPTREIAAALGYRPESVRTLRNRWRRAAA